MSQYNTGSVALTSGSVVVTGTSTAWLANVSVGDVFILTSDSVPYYVASVDTDTQITLSAPYAGLTATGSEYTAVRDFTNNFGFPFITKGDIETAKVLEKAVTDIDQVLAGFGSTTMRYTNASGVPSFVAMNPLQFINAAGAALNVYTL